jgi:hypothetical protein
MMQVSKTLSLLKQNKNTVLPLFKLLVLHLIATPHFYYTSGKPVTQIPQ